MCSRSPASAPPAACTWVRWRWPSSSRPVVSSTRSGCSTGCASTATAPRPRSERLASAGVGDRLEDLGLDLLAVHLVLHGVAALLAVDRLAQRGLRGEDLQLVTGHLAGAEEELLLHVVVDQVDGHLHARLDDTIVRRRLADLGALEHLGQLGDPAVPLAELVAGGVVAGVLLQVALVA